MGQRLEDDTFLVHENDVPVPEHLHIEGTFAVFGIKRKGEDAVKTHLLYPGEPSVSKVFPQHHGKGRRRHWHGSVPLRGVDSLTSNEHHVALVGLFGVNAKHDLLVMGHVGLLDVGALQGVQFPCHRTEVKAGHRLLHRLTRMVSKGSDDMKVSEGHDSTASVAALNRPGRGTEGGLSRCFWRRECTGEPVEPRWLQTRGRR